jgi:hypothetical protein
MNFSKDVSKLLTNKYFLYFMVFLAATNVLGYLVLHKFNAVIFFALVSLLAYQFSKNMAVILLIALVATNFMMSSKMLKEGLENQTASNTTTNDDTELSKTDSTINDAAAALKANPTVEQAKASLATKKQQVMSNVSSETGINNTNITAAQDPNNPTLNSGTSDEEEIEGFGQQQKAKAGFHNANRQHIGAPISDSTGKGQGQGPRLDYASTMEAAYDNLDKMLGGDGIKQLTSDTQKLMAQQQQLFNTMNQMAPMLESAQNMLQGFDFKSLGNLSGLAQQLGVSPTVKAAT